MIRQSIIIALTDTRVTQTSKAVFTENIVRHLSGKDQGYQQLFCNTKPER